MADGSVVDDLPLSPAVCCDPFDIRCPRRREFFSSHDRARLTDGTYFDIRYTAPGIESDQEARNWQTGPAVTHTIGPGTRTGTWTTTGVRPHQDIDNHSGKFLAVSIPLRVSE